MLKLTMKDNDTMILECDCKRKHEIKVDADGSYTVDTTEPEKEMSMFDRIAKGKQKDKG